MVEALPTLILISLGLFFVALADYIWTVNTEVAALICAFSALWTLLYLAMLLSAALFPQCPYQTAPSAALVAFARFGLRPAYLIIRNPFVASLHQLLLLGGKANNYMHSSCGLNAPWDLFNLASAVGRLWTPATRLWTPKSNDLKDRKNVESLHVESALAIIELAPHESVAVAVARNIPALQDLQELQRLADSPVVLFLAAHLNKQLSRVRDELPGTTEVSAIYIARALVHILLANPYRYGSDVLGHLLTIHWSEASDIPAALPSSELKVLWTCIVQLCAQVSTLKAVEGDQDIPWRTTLQYVPYKYLLEKGLCPGGAISSPTAERYLHHFILSERFLPSQDENSLGEFYKGGIDLPDMIRTFHKILADDSIPTTVSLLGLASRALSIALESFMGVHTSKRLSSWDRLTRAWEIRSG